MKLVWLYLQSMLLDLLPVVPVVLLLRLGVCFYHRKKGRKTTALHETGVILLALFLAGLASVTVSLDFLFRGDFTICGEVSLVPFRTILIYLSRGTASELLINIWGNIGLFVPIGFCVPLLWEKRQAFRWALLCGFGVSFLIEFLQLFSFRTTDVDDLILNTLGACLGWLAFALLDRLFPRAVEKFRMKRISKC